MRKMTMTEFKVFLRESYDMDGITEDEVYIYYLMYETGRQSVKW